MSAPFVIVGGGIAAVSATQSIAEECPDAEIVLISGGPIVKAVKNWARRGKVLESFDVAETSAAEAFAEHPPVRVIEDRATAFDPKRKMIRTHSGLEQPYSRLCVCSGGLPKIPFRHPRVLGIRDTETVRDLEKRLGDARRIIVLGNGGIATELVHEVEGVEVVWAIRDASIAAAFVDAGAATFFLPHLEMEKQETGPSRHPKYAATQAAAACSGVGSALGPDWAHRCCLQGPGKGRRPIFVEYSCECECVLSAEELAPDFAESSGSEVSWPVYARLSNGRSFGADLIVSATGVRPNADLWKRDAHDLHIAEDGGILVNENFESSIDGVYAAGDVCTAGWPQAPHWLQMRLWTQARQMGAMAGLCMAAASKGHVLHQDIAFELFTHCTSFFGLKVILLGRFNSQGLGPTHEALLRVKKGEEYVKVLVGNGRVQGAVLIGETDLEETLENLILDQVDIDRIKDRLLDPDIDIEDYFD